MNGFEWVGFFISFFAVLLLIGRAVYDTYQSAQNPSKYRAQQEEAERRFKAFLRGEAPPPAIERALKQVVEEEDEEQEEREREQARLRLLQRQKKEEKKHIQPSPWQNPVESMSPGYFEKTLPTPSLEEYPSRAETLVYGEKSLQEMVLLYEIFGPPKSMR